MAQRQKKFVSPRLCQALFVNYLTHMIKAANIYVINWVIQDFYNRGIVIDPCIHIKYLQHYSRVLTWLKKKFNFNGLEKLFL